VWNRWFLRLFILLIGALLILSGCNQLTSRDQVLETVIVVQTSTTYTHQAQRPVDQEPVDLIGPALPLDATPQAALAETITPLTSDFEPCGHPSGKVQIPAAHRALLAWSSDGINFQRPEDRQEGFVMDQISVPDAVALPSGRILLYLVTGCRIVDGVPQESNNIAVVVSDQEGKPGSWIFKNVHFKGLPEMYGDNPLDPNAVVLPDGNISLFTTVFWQDEEPLERSVESDKSAIAAFLSTDGGFTFTFRNIVYPDNIDPENYRFTETNWQILTGEPSEAKGMAFSSDDGFTFQPLGSFPDKRAVQEIAETETPGVYRSYISGAEGILSYIATSDPWTTWELEPGFRLEVDPSSGLESCDVRFPTVVKLTPDRYLMIYETTIPGCQCIDVDPVCE